MKAIICNDVEEFNNINNRIHEGRKQDIPNLKPTKWADPIEHPVDGRIAIPIEKSVEKYLTQDEIDRIEELPADWFPTPEEI